VPLAGKQIQPRDLAEMCDEREWHGLELVRMVATILSESQGYTRAYHDNVENGIIVSRDVGLGEVNIAARHIGTPVEEILYDPEENLDACRRLYEQPWNSPSGIRRFQPWAGFTSGWAMFPEWWIWNSKDKQWVKPGRYLMRAARGVGNFNARYLGMDLSHINLDWDETGSSTMKEPKPPFNPPEDGIGPRPVPNDGDPQ
jgi:hypothetical protein